MKRKLFFFASCKIQTCQFCHANKQQPLPISSHIGPPPRPVDPKTQPSSSSFWSGIYTPAHGLKELICCSARNIQHHRPHTQHPPVRPENSSSSLSLSLSPLLPLAFSHPLTTPPTNPAHFLPPISPKSLQIEEDHPFHLPSPTKKKKKLIIPPAIPTPCPRPDMDAPFAISFYPGIQQS